MDEAQLREVLQQKQQNPRLQRIPLNLGKKFLQLNESGTEVQIANVLTQYEVVLLLFGSEWVTLTLLQCNITKPFVKLLQKHYEEINLEAKNLEIIYISFDKNKKDFDNFALTMPWLGIAFDDARVKDLKQFYNVRSIPYLILVDNKGEIVSNQCRNDIYTLAEDPAFEKWKKQKEQANKIENQQQLG